MKCFFKKVLEISLISIFCAGCQKSRYPTKTFDYNPSALYKAFDIYNSKVYVYKVKFKNVCKDLYEYKPNTVDLNADYPSRPSTEYGFINYPDRFVYAESESTFIASSHFSDVDKITAYILLDDSCYGNMFGYLRKRYISPQNLSSFITSYDYFYVLTTQTYSFNNYPNREIYQRKNKITINDGVLISPKSFCMLPIKDNKLKLDELVNFHKENYEIGYTYEQMQENNYETNERRQFVDLFWNDMDEDVLISSYQQLIDNPPSFDLFD